MDFNAVSDNVARFGNKYGFYLVPIPFVRVEFVHAADKLTLWNDGLGGLLAITNSGLWYPFWPEKAGQRFPELPPEGMGPAWYEGYADWKDAAIAALNPAEHIFPGLENISGTVKDTQGYKVWKLDIETRLPLLRDPFVADVNETLLIGLKREEKELES